MDADKRYDIDSLERMFQETLVKISSTSSQAERLGLALRVWQSWPIYHRAAFTICENVADPWVREMQDWHWSLLSKPLARLTDRAAHVMLEAAADRGIDATSLLSESKICQRLICSRSTFETINACDADNFWPGALGDETGRLLSIDERIVVRAGEAIVRQLAADSPGDSKGRDDGRQQHSLPQRCSINYDNWGIGCCGDSWRIFRLSNGKLCERGKLDVSDNANDVLVAIIEGGGKASIEAIANRMYKVQTKRKQSQSVKTAVSRLRSDLKSAFARVTKHSIKGIPDPIPSRDSRYALLPRVFYAGLDHESGWEVTLIPTGTA